MTKVQLNLDGHADVHRRPERAVFKITIQKKATDQKHVSDEVQAQAQVIQDIVKPLAQRGEDGEALASTAIIRWSSSSLSTRSWMEKYDAMGLGSMQRVYSAEIEMAFRFRDMDELARLTAKLSTMPLVTIGNVEWVLTDETRELLKAEVYAKAYADALSKAEVLRHAMGASKVAVTEVQDQPAGFSRLSMANTTMQYQMPQQMRMQGVSGFGSGGGDALAYVPQDVTQSISLRCKFECE